MTIINQDRDHMYQFNSERLYKMARHYQGVLIGYNLYLGSNLLGTFDTVEEVEQEECMLLNCKHDIYAINGYSQGWENYP